MSRIEQLRQFLEDNPRDCFLRHALALEYVKINELEAARNLFEENRKQDPSYIATYYHLGQLLERMAVPQEALNIYREGMEAARNSGDEHAFGELRSAYEELLY